jgi:hypothetical protein
VNGDRLIRVAAAATVAGLAGIAGAISYSHMRQLAQGHGQAGWHAHAFPLSVDGLELVASLVLLSDRRHGRQSGCLPWAALITGTAGSLAANIATAPPDLIGRIVAGWPALALLISVKLLSGILEHHSTEGNPTVPEAAPAGTDLTDAGTGQAAAARRPSTVPPAAPNRRSPLPAPGSGTGQARSGPLIRSAAARRTRSPAAPGDGLDPGFGVLLPAARAARDELQRDGCALTRDALAASLRQHGHRVRNARLTPLLQHLKDECSQDQPVPIPDTRPSATGAEAA